MRKGLMAWLWSTIGFVMFYGLWVSFNHSKPTPIGIAITLILGILIGIYFYIRDRKDKRGPNWPKK